MPEGQNVEMGKMVYNYNYSSEWNRPMAYKVKCTSITLSEFFEFGLHESLYGPNAHMFGYKNDTVEPSK